MPWAGQNSLRRLVSLTSRCDTVSVTLSASVGILTAGVFATSALLRGTTEDSLDGCEFRRTLSVPCRAGNRRVIELQAGQYTAQHETAAAHIASPDKRRREDETLAEDRLQHFDVLAGRDAAK